MSKAVKRSRVYKKKKSQRRAPPPDAKWHLVAAALLEPTRAALSLREQIAFLKRVDNKANWSVRGKAIAYKERTVAHIRRTTDGRGYGVFAAANIPAGAVIMPYFGDAVTIAAVDRMPWADRSQVENYSLAHHTDGDKLITGFPSKNAKHFGALVNDPYPLAARANVNFTNFDTLSDKTRVPAADVPHPLCVATKRIRKGDELLLDYQWSETDWARIRQHKPALPTEQHVMGFTLFEMLGIGATAAHKREFAISAAWAGAPSSYPERLKIADKLLVAMNAELRAPDAKRLRDGWPSMDAVDALNKRIDAVMAPDSVATEAAAVRGVGGGGTGAQRKVAVRLREVSSEVRAAGAEDTNPELSFETAAATTTTTRRTARRGRKAGKANAKTAARLPVDINPELAF